MKEEIKTMLIAIAAGLQSMVDCIWLGVPDNITPAIVVAVIFVIWSILFRRQEQRRLHLKQKRNPVKMYIVGRMN